jgi:hypothetical protein
MKTPQELAEQMAAQTDQQLQDMFARPADWTPQALDAARAELQKRGLRPVEAAPPPPNKDYEVLPSGRKRLLKATVLDIVISIFIPGWGIIVGAIALFVKHEKKRGLTMMIIGICALLLLIFTHQF